MAEILKDSGYSPSIQRHPSTVTDSASFKKALAVEARPIIDGLQAEITRIKAAMARKNLDNEEYRVLAGSLDIMVHNYQLLSGGATERNILVLPSEVMERNAIEASKDVPLSLEDGSTKPS